MNDENRKFYDYLSVNNIICRAETGNGMELLHMLLDLLHRHVPELDSELAANEVMAREAIFPTVVAPGLAVPHARLPGLEFPLVALGCSPRGVDFNLPDDKIKVMVLLLTPLSEPNLHMRLLAALAEDFNKPGAIDKIAQLPTPAEVMKHFEGNVAVMPDFLTAADVMRDRPVTLRETDTVRQAIISFATSREEEMVVLDREGDIRGVVALGDLLKFSLPEHLLWLEDLSPIYRFQPFSDMLKNSDDTRVADIMREEFLRVNAKVPAIQLAKLFLVHKLRQLVIVDDSDRLAGVVEIKDFCGKLFWE